VKERDRQVIHSSICANWRTPDPFFEALDDEFDFVIDLAADRGSKKCQLWLGPGSVLGEDALIVPWADKGPGFLNPPWSREDKLPILPWVEKCVQESQAGWSGVSIFPASIQTKWWQILRRHAYEIRIIPHRVSFALGEEDLVKWRERQQARGLKGQDLPSSASGNTAVVVWKDLSHYRQPWEAGLRYWSYRPPQQQDHQD